MGPAGILTTVKLLSCALLAMSATNQSSHAAPVPLDANKPYAAADYAFLSPAIGASRVVALGESIHVTREMPRIRLQMVRYLHEQMGFNLIAFEGSLMDAWTAQEHAYQVKDSLEMRAAAMKREAFFGLWQTTPMQPSSPTRSAPRRPIIPCMSPASTCNRVWPAPTVVRRSKHARVLRCGRAL